ncbi:MAG TPA: transglycosylase family protein [Streptosporangiaceae bacterium]|nr:transglycosylase family protein [Streptosporangiaceae bacterium]
MSLPSIAAGGAAKTMLAVTVSVHPVAVAHGSHFVTARPGDTLSSLSQHEFGRAGDWPALWWANRKSVPDPGMLRVGQRLRVPVQHQVSPWLMRAALAASPAPAPAAAPATSVTSAPAQTYTAASGSFQSCVIQAESGGNAGAVNPYTGAGGLYGFLPSTWQALGFSGLPENASVAEQNAAFAKEYAQSGSSAWSAYDGC